MGNIAHGSSGINPHAANHSSGAADAISHDDLADLNTSTYTHLSATQATDLTDGGETTLHTHAAGAPGHADVLILNEQSAAPSTLAGHFQVYGVTVVDEYVKLLLHCDGSDAGTTFTDGLGHTFSRGGDAQTSTASKKFGTASLLLDGTGDYIYTADSDDFYFGSEDFTIDFWAYFSSFPDEAGIMCQGDHATNWAITVYSSYVKLKINGSDIISRTGLSLATNAWMHFAFVRNGNNWYLFIDGTMVGDVTSSSSSMPNIASNLEIGRYKYSSVLWLYANARLDEIRISKGIARWTNTFTPPTSPYILTSYSLRIKFPDGTEKTVTLT
jgi:hypothetical protein